MLPLFVRRGLGRRGPLARAVASEPGVYGGPLAAGGRLGPDGWRDFARALPGLPFGRIDFFGSVLDPLPDDVADQLGASTRESWVIDLRRLPPAAEESYAANCRRNVRRALREGVRVGREPSTEALREYYGVYQDSLRRWHKRPSQGYALELFAGLVARPGIELWCARSRAGRVVAGGLFLFAPRHVVYWQGAMLEEFAELRPSNALHHELILEARRRGALLYDFNPSGGHAGVDAFKRSFGAERVAFPTWTFRSRLVRWLAHAREPAR